MIIVGLGSNKGERFENLQNAVKAIAMYVTDMECSPVYKSKALLAKNAPPEWNRDFLNMAVLGETRLTPEELLVKVKATEQALGRTPTGYWGPREIDIDILCFDDKIINAPDLIIPHAHLLARDFALVPLAYIAPDWVHPKAGKTASELAGKLANSLQKTDYRCVT